MPAAENLPSITSRTYVIVQDLMRREGLNSNDPTQVSLYIERFFARERLFRTVQQVRSATAAIPENELQRMIDEAVEEVEAVHRFETRER